MTSLYDNIIFGPIRSRRLGLSLGVNLLPIDSKLCSFDCIYCECGWNDEHPGRRRFNAREDVSAMLATTLQKMVADGTPPDVITFAGNGEPTLHPDFEQIIDDTIALRDKYCPEAKVSVLSNATQIHRDDVRRALLRVDNNILKLDSAFDATVELINKPQGNYTVARTVELLKAFEGKLIVQTMFLRGEYLSHRVDNTTDEEVEAWLKLVAEINPKQVMVYSLDRDTPCQTLEKVEKDELRKIAERVEALGIPCSVA
ncbi:MAG: radical SAM protein [Alistipes sp.]|nr:radical SAM protein [Alistipes sp.]